MVTAKDIVTHVLVPILFVGLLSGLVVYILASQSKEVISDVQNGDFVEKRISGIFSEQQAVSWEPLYGGGIGHDEIVAVTDRSLRISTKADGGWYGARSTVSSDITNANSLSFAVRFENWYETERVMILFATDKSFSDYFGINLNNYFADPVDNDWRHVVIDRSAFEVIEGNPDWSSITHMAIRVVSVPGKVTRVWFDDFQIHAAPRQEAVLTMTFDDGFDSVVGAKEIMNRYGIKGTAYIIPKLVDTEGYMTQDDIDQLAFAGWDIGGHGNKNLTQLDPADVDADLALTYQYLDIGEYQGREHYAYPNGGYSQSVQSQVLEYFTSARTIDGFQQPPELVYPQNVNAVTISSITPVTDIIREIDTAIENGTWLILVWHDLNYAPDLDYEYNVQDFEWIVKYISEQDIEVLPYSKAYQKIVK